MKDKPVNGWDFTLWKDGSMIFVSLLYIAAIFGWLYWPSVYTLIIFTFLLGVWLLVVWFFRNPTRQVVDESGVVVGPGDGKVVAIEKEKETRYLNKEVIRISIFLNVTDVHIQRAPLGGKITMVDHQPGKFLQAFKPEASDVNEYVAMQVETKYGTILMKQIAGILARRCVNFAQVGDEIATGQRFGLIKFSSRVDLFLPPGAEILVKVGDRVTGGRTRIAQLEGGA